MQPAEKIGVAVAMSMGLFAAICAFVKASALPTLSDLDFPCRWPQSVLNFDPRRNSTDDTNRYDSPSNPLERGRARCHDHGGVTTHDESAHPDLSPRQRPVGEPQQRHYSGGSNGESIRQEDGGLSDATLRHSESASVALRVYHLVLGGCWPRNPTSSPGTPAARRFPTAIQ